MTQNIEQNKRDRQNFWFVRKAEWFFLVVPINFYTFICLYGVHDAGPLALHERSYYGISVIIIVLAFVHDNCVTFRLENPAAYSCFIGCAGFCLVLCIGMNVVAVIMMLS